MKSLLVRCTPLLFCAASCLQVTVKDPASELLSLEIPFEAVVDEAPFACGVSYDNLGLTGTTYQPMDFRLYVHNVRLVDPFGEEVPVTLSEDGLFQHQGVALLDFADQGGLCSNGTAATHTKITGTAPAGDYTGLRFTLGLPFEQNHQDATLAPAPLNDLGMFWGWQFGYLFARIEGATNGLPQGHNFHLGSTGCAPPKPGQNGSTGCANPNTLEVDLAGFTPGEVAVFVDLGSLFLDSDLDSNTPETAVGCMSFPGDPECEPIFGALGLPFGNIPAQANAQRLFYLGGSCARLAAEGGPVPYHCEH
jgi:uncharacterized repeat protein (TIGR04052 family)